MRFLYGSSGQLGEQQLLQAVLILEQFMTTGGGWQDQVGGLVAGAKIGRTSTQVIPPHICRKYRAHSRKY